MSVRSGLSSRARSCQLTREHHAAVESLGTHSTHLATHNSWAGAWECRNKRSACLLSQLSPTLHTRTCCTPTYTQHGNARTHKARSLHGYRHQPISFRCTTAKRQRPTSAQYRSAPAQYRSALSVTPCRWPKRPHAQCPVRHSAPRTRHGAHLVDARSPRTA